MAAEPCRTSVAVPLGPRRPSWKEAPFARPAGSWGRLQHLFLASTAGAGGRGACVPGGCDPSGHVVQGGCVSVRPARRSRAVSLLPGPAGPLQRSVASLVFSPRLLNSSGPCAPRRCSSRAGKHHVRSQTECLYPTRCSRSFRPLPPAQGGRGQETASLPGLGARGLASWLGKRPLLREPPPPMSLGGVR